MTEGEAYERLCDSIGNLCDCWQMAQVSDQQFIRLGIEALHAWLKDQKANTPKD